MRARPFAWFSTLVAIVTAAACEDGKASADDDDTSGASGGGTTQGDCESWCEQSIAVAEAAGCEAGDQASCVGECEFEGAGCESVQGAYLGCLSERVTLTCEPTSSGCYCDGETDVCSSEQTAFIDCVKAQPEPPPGPGDCYSAVGSCSPLNPTGCGPGEACDVNGQTGMLECFPPPNDVPENGACHNQTGPYCKHGLACDPSSLTCRPYCCAQSDCNSGTCTAVYDGAMACL